MELKTDVNTLLIADALFSCKAFLETLALTDAILKGDKEPASHHLLRKVTIALRELGVDSNLLNLPKIQSLTELYTKK